MEDDDREDFQPGRFVRNLDMHHHPPDEPLYDPQDETKEIGAVRYHKVPTPEDPEVFEWLGSIHLHSEEKEPLPVRHPKAKFPKGRKGKACNDYNLGFIGHWFMFCFFQRKCLIRRLSKVEISKEVIERFSEDTAYMTRKDRILYMFNNLAYSYISSKTADFIHDLQYGEYGLERRGSLTNKQFIWLKRIYLESKTLELRDKINDQKPEE